MSPDFLLQFRRHLRSWFESRLADGRTPFRRIEETPPLWLEDHCSPPDLVLWINRDSLLAGALILIPAKIDATSLQQAAATSATLGLVQFVTWEPQGARLWQIAGEAVSLQESWALPPAPELQPAHFAAIGDQLLRKLQTLAIVNRRPPEALPAGHFANLCLLTLHAVQPGIDEATRLTAGNGLSDAAIAKQGRAKGWMTLWRLLALLWHQRLPHGMQPERLERAMSYALADLPAPLPEWLTPVATEAPLPESVAVRWLQLAGRLQQLGWATERRRADNTLGILLAAATARFQLCPDRAPNDGRQLLVNQLPLTALGSDLVTVAPRPCLAGWLLQQSFEAGAPSPAAVTALAQLPTGWSPRQVTAWLEDPDELAPIDRRRQLVDLRRAWPYRRFTLPAKAPRWVWEALFLAGLTDLDGELRLTLPPGWHTVPGAELLWQLLAEQRGLRCVLQHADGRQTLEWTAIDRGPATIAVLEGGVAPVKTTSLAATGVTPARLAELHNRPGATGTTPAPAKPTRMRLTQQIAATVFRDGLPRFPEHYLRRRDIVELHTYSLPGPLHSTSSFFDRCRLEGPNGAWLEVDSPVTAEALIVTAAAGAKQVNLPVDPLITAELLDAYRCDLRGLWQVLMAECRRHPSRQREARALARRIWQKQGLPAFDTDPC